MVFVSPEEVESGTGASVTSADISAAQFIIETISGVLVDPVDPKMATVDLGWLKRAVIYQTAWMQEQVDVLSRMDAARVMDDGSGIFAENGLTFVLAPLAKRALKNCTWAKSGTLRVSPATTSMADVNLIAADNHPWEPMRGL